MPVVNSVYIGTESIALPGPKLLEFVPKKMKQNLSLNPFKDEIKNVHQQVVHVKDFTCRTCEFINVLNHRNIVEIIQSQQ